MLFALDFINVHFLELGRDANELDTSALDKMVTVIKHCWDYFSGLIARAAKDTSALIIVPRALKPACVLPAAIAAKGTAPKHPSPEPNAARDFEQPATRPRCDGAGQPGRFRLPTVPQVDPKEKGFYYIRDPNNEHRFPSNINCCLDFVTKGRECPAPPGQCDFKHIYRDKNHVRMIEQIGDHFLETDAGWFDNDALRHAPMSDKYKNLKGNKNGPFGASSE